MKVEELIKEVSEFLGKVTVFGTVLSILLATVSGNTVYFVVINVMIIMAVYNVMITLVRSLVRGGLT